MNMKFTNLELISKYIHQFHPRYNRRIDIWTIVKFKNNFKKFKYKLTEKDLWNTFGLLLKKKLVMFSFKKTELAEYLK